jgi:hypothetical protein
MKKLTILFRFRYTSFTDKVDLLFVNFFDKTTPDSAQN